MYSVQFKENNKLTFLEALTRRTKNTEMMILCNTGLCAD